jgi:hypothetical protein
LAFKKPVSSSFGAVLGKPLDKVVAFRKVGAK